MRRNEPSQRFKFALLSKTTGDAVTTGTPTGVVAIDDGAQAACAGTFAHRGSGQWIYRPTQAETNGADVGFLIVHADAIPVHAQFFPEVYSPDGFLSVNVEEIDTAEADPPDAAAPLTSADIPAIATAAVNLMLENSTAQTGDNFPALSALLAAVQRSQDGGNVVTGGTTTIVVSGLAIPVGNLPRMMAEVFNGSNVLVGRAPIASAATSGGNIALTFDAPGFSPAVGTDHTVLVS